MFKKNNPIFVDLGDNSLNDIKITKNTVNFSIKIKETIENDKVGKFVWFLYVELPKSKKWKLCAYGVKKFNGYTDCQNDAFNFFQSLKYEYFKSVKDL